MIINQRSSILFSRVSIVLLGVDDVVEVFSLPALPPPIVQPFLGALLHNDQEQYANQHSLVCDDETSAEGKSDPQTLAMFIGIRW
jgi:hypothetical protein